MKKQILNLSFLGIIGALFLTNADAAPTVKKLGTTNNVVRTTNTGVKSDSSNLSRASSARFNSAKPVVKTTSAPVVKTTNTAVADSNDARLSLGKYLHSVNVNKATPSGTGTAGVASNDFIELKDRVTKNEADIATATQDFKDHIDDADIHVSLEDKDKWNDKQDALTAGDGIKINDRGVISSVMLLPVGSENAKPSAPIWIE